ncbi:hypothetical protein ACHAXR_012440 [Thalassiosira sp. AJA248-18]
MSSSSPLSNHRQSSRRQSSIRNNNANNTKTNDKTYVWVRLRDGTFSPHHATKHSSSSSVANKKRGAPSDDVWGWAPGYYSVVAAATTNSLEEEKEGILQYHFTVLGLDNSNNTGGQSSDNNDDFQKSEHTLSEASSKQLFESGEIVLANAWEGYDFVHRLELDGDDDYDDDESEYNYDDDDDSDEDDDQLSTSQQQIINHDLLDTPDDAPPSNLIELTHLHEPSVVHALRHRYMNTTYMDSMNNIYTDTGPILLAVNPFKHDESGTLYGENTVNKYRREGEGRWRKEREEMLVGNNNNNGKEKAAASVAKNGEVVAVDDDDESSSSSLPPHVYAVADRTFRTMMTRLHPPIDISPSSNAAAASASNKARSNNNAPPQPPSASSKVNQSVLVSGESGAGKTVTTKLLMAYLSKLSESPAIATTTSSTTTNSTTSASGTGDNNNEHNDKGSSSIMSIEKRVLESNPIMESFGNARTIRNDNSSRFGKYIEMKFVSSSSSSSNNKNGKSSSTTTTMSTKNSTISSLWANNNTTLVGASIETYLLEKVRLVHQSPGERNYHIFYELFSMKYNQDDDDEEEVDSLEAVVEKIGLLDYDMQDFRLINTSNTYDRRDGVSDATTFREMKRAMSIMGFTPNEINAVFEVTSALLHASNLSFERIGEVECALVMDNPHLEYVVNLLGITKEGLNQALCYYEITIGGGGKGRKGGETHQRVLSLEQVEKGVEALIKATYGAMFNYLVKRINESVAGEKKEGGGGGGKVSRTRRDSEKGASIGILDIFGFESFQVNSFEQLCINYCNESLQQQFNGFVLRNEQEEYDREGIPWSFIEFPDNQAVLDLIDLKGSGILNILHDQCRTPGASDKTFALRMYEKCSTHQRFEADARQVAEELFAVHHYAGLVEYDVEGFVEKTRDELPKSGSDLLLSSKNDFVKTLAEILQPNSASSVKGKQMMSPRSGAAQRPTVGIQFSSQLQSLRCKIDDTSPHYIRCLKPNNLLVPDHFDAALIADQLRCAGVIEAVRVSRLGYPQRFSHNQFIARYRLLGKKVKKKNTAKKYNPAKALVHSITQRLLNDQPDVGIQVGKSKVFLKRQAYDLLEKLRRDRIASATVSIQKTARRYICQKLLVKAMRSLLIIQRFVRKLLAVKLVAKMRRQHNSIVIQQYWRRYAAKKLISSAVSIALWCQRCQRGSAGRQRYNELNRERKVTYLQSQWRGCLASKRFRRHINAILTIQCAARCFAARNELCGRKSKARDFTAVVQERDRLRQEASALRNELEKMKDENKVEGVQKSHVAEGSSSKSNERDAEIESLRIALDQLSKQKEDADYELQEANKMLITLKSERDLVVVDRDDLKQVNKLLQIELMSREEELQCMKKDLKKNQKTLKTSNISLDGNSNAQETQSAKVVGTDTSQVVELKNELRCLKQSNAALQEDNVQLKDENSSLRSKAVGVAESIGGIKKGSNEPTRRLNEASNSQKDAGKRSTTVEGESSDAVADKKSVTIEEKSPGAVLPSVCTSFTVDMDMSEEEVSKLREENQVLRRQLELLRVNQEFQLVPDDQEFDDSVAPDSKSSSVVQDSKSTATEYIGEANALPESAMKQLLSEVEIVTEEVIIKTRAESESEIAKLQSEIEELKAEMERSQRLAKYDLDDMTRVNRSLREDLESVSKTKLSIEEELEMKSDEFDALNEDVERFAETFAAQHEELQQLESQTKKLLLENEKLKKLDEEKMKRVAELETQLEAKSSEMVVSEIAQLWQEIGKIRGTPQSVSSKPSRRGKPHHRSTNSSSSDTSSEESEGGEDTSKANYQAMSLLSAAGRTLGLRGTQAPASVSPKSSLSQELKIPPYRGTQN